MRTARVSFEKVEQWVMGLNPERADDRETWVRVGMAVNNFDDGPGGYALFERFSSQSNKFNAADCRRVWASFKGNTSTPVTTATLSMMFMQDNGLKPRSGGQAKAPAPKTEKPATGQETPKKPKLWNTPEHAGENFQALPVAWTDQRAIDYLSEHYGLHDPAMIPDSWRVFEHPTLGIGIVYPGVLPRSSDIVYKFKAFARDAKGKRHMAYLHGGGGALVLAHQTPADWVVVAGEEKAAAIHAVGFNVLSPLTGENALHEEWCRELAKTDGRVIVANDGDEAGRKANSGTLERLEAAGMGLDRLAAVTWPGEAGYDANDYLKAHGREALRALIDRTPMLTPDITPPLKLHSIDDLFAIEVPETDRMLGDWVISAGELTLIVGPPGIGKSRLVNQLVFDMLMDRGDWLGVLPIHRHDLRILIIQTENGVRRLQSDFGAQMRGCTGDQRRAVKERLRFHVPLSIADRDLSLDDQDNITRLERTVRLARPDLIVLDPYGDLFAGDSENDAVQTRRTVKAIFQVCKAYSEKTAIVLIHHAKSGRQAASEAVGWDRQAYARGSKALMSIARSQINIAPGDEDAKSLLITCGKLNDGKEFKPFAVTLDDDLRYRLDPDFSIDSWREEVSSRSGKKSGRKALLDDTMVLVRLPADGAEIALKAVVDSVMDGHGVSRRTVFNLIENMIDRGLIARRIEKRGAIQPVWIRKNESKL